MEAIRLFDEGKSWECGIPLCRELAKLYEMELFDYQKLAAILVSRRMSYDIMPSMLQNDVAVHPD